MKLQEESRDFVPAIDSVAFLAAAVAMAVASLALLRAVLSP